MVSPGAAVVTTPPRHATCGGGASRSPSAGIPAARLSGREILSGGSLTNGDSHVIGRDSIQVEGRNAAVHGEDGLRGINVRHRLSARADVEIEKRVQVRFAKL